MVAVSFYRKNLYLFLLISFSMQARVVHVVDDRGLLDSKKQMVIKFAAEWCSACQHIAEPFEIVSDEAEFQHVLFVHIDIDRHDDVSKQHEVLGVPTFAYLDNGSKKGQVTGAKDLSSFKDHLRESIRLHFNMPLGQSRVLASAADVEGMNTCLVATNNDDNLFNWVWNGIAQMFDDVANAFKSIFA